MWNKQGHRVPLCQKMHTSPKCWAGQVLLFLSFIFLVSSHFSSFISFKTHRNNIKTHNMVIIIIKQYVSMNNKDTTLLKDVKLVGKHH